MVSERIGSPQEGALVQLLSVNVARPRVLGVYAGKRIVSAIGKQPVTEATLWLDRLNLEGDRQADRRVHGGPDKAVYVYPADHWPRWSEELGRPFGPASFGENLTIAGWTEGEVCIGDVWAWGEALLEVSQPRGPCYKLGMHTGREEIVELMRQNGRTGWYLRVLRPGRVPVRGPIVVAERHPARVSVLEAHRATQPGTMPDDERRRILAEAPLAESWRRSIRRLLGHLGHEE